MDNKSILRNSWIYRCLTTEVQQPNQTKKNSTIAKICQTENNPPFYIKKHEVVDIISDNCLKIYMVYDKRLKVQILKNLRCCSTKNVQSLEKHALLCFKCNVDVRHSILTKDSYNTSGTSKYKCPEEFHIVLVMKDMDCSACLASQSNGSSHPAEKSALWYHDINECESLIQAIIRNKLDSQYAMMTGQSLNFDLQIIKVDNSPLTEEAVTFESWESEGVLQFAVSSQPSAFPLSSEELLDGPVSQESMNDTEGSLAEKTSNGKSCDSRESYYSQHSAEEVVEDDVDILGPDSLQSIRQGPPSTDEPFIVEEIPSLTNTKLCYDPALGISASPENSEQVDVNNDDIILAKCDVEEYGQPSPVENMETDSIKSVTPELSEFSSLSLEESYHTAPADLPVTDQVISIKNDEGEEIDVGVTEVESIAIPELSICQSTPTKNGSSEEEESEESPANLKGTIIAVPFKPCNKKDSQEIQNEYGFICKVVVQASKVTRKLRYGNEPESLSPSARGPITAQDKPLLTSSISNSQTPSANLSSAIDETVKTKRLKLSTTDDHLLPSPGSVLAEKNSGIEVAPVDVTSLQPKKPDIVQSQVASPHVSAAEQVSTEISSLSSHEPATALAADNTRTEIQQRNNGSPNRQPYISGSGLEKSERKDFTDFRISADLMDRTLHYLYWQTMVSKNDQQKSNSNSTTQSITLIDKRNHSSTRKRKAPKNPHEKDLSAMQCSVDLLNRTFQHFMCEISLQTETASRK